jgi:HD-GYP domain-containing protein (c-di-GMP phosphodiesterase class II)
MTVRACTSSFCGVNFLDQLVEIGMNDLQTMLDGVESMQPEALHTMNDRSGFEQGLEADMEDPAELSLVPAAFQAKKSLQKVFEDVVQAMGEMIEVRDVYTAGHQRRVSHISVEIARAMALPVFQIKGIQLSAMVHDIGKLAIPTEILSKPGRLSVAEFELIKTHSVIGHSILRDIEFPWPIAQTVLQHHERINGTGYPSGLSGHEILIEARILSVADVIEAMASNRPYRPAIGIDRALAEISGNKNTLYDANVVEACLHLFESGALAL